MKAGVKRKRKLFDAVLKHSAWANLIWTQISWFMLGKIYICMILQRALTVEPTADARKLFGIPVQSLTPRPISCVPLPAVFFPNQVWSCGGVRGSYEALGPNAVGGRSVNFASKRADV